MGVQASPVILAIAEAADRICPQFGKDPLACVQQAFAISRNGQAAARWNCWNLPAGLGDAPDVVLTVARRAPPPQYVRLEKRRISTFSGPDAAVLAWCRRG
jgi:hypothetical protein